MFPAVKRKSLWSRNVRRHPPSSHGYRLPGNNHLGVSNVSGIASIIQERASQVDGAVLALLTNSIVDMSVFEDSLPVGIFGSSTRKKPLYPAEAGKMGPTGRIMGAGNETNF
jgi:hypothetical protein